MPVPTSSHTGLAPHASACSLARTLGRTSDLFCLPSAKMLNGTPATYSLARWGQVLVAALAGGVLATAATWTVASVIPMLFSPSGLFPHLVPTLVADELTAIAAGSIVVALPVSLLLGIPVLFAAFTWTKRPFQVATVAGSAIGPALLSALFALSGASPQRSAPLLLLVGVVGALGASSAALFLSRLNSARTPSGAA